MGENLSDAARGFYNIGEVCADDFPDWEQKNWGQFRLSPIFLSPPMLSSVFCGLFDDPYSGLGKVLVLNDLLLGSNMSRDGGVLCLLFGAGGL